LAFPYTFKKVRKEYFQALIDKIRSRLAAWKTYTLTQAPLLEMLLAVCVFGF
jgi:hypothetical protein